MRKQASSKIHQYIELDEVNNLALQVNNELAQEHQKRFLKDSKLALKSYKKWKKENREILKDFLASYKRAKHNSELKSLARTISKKRKENQDASAEVKLFRSSIEQVFSDNVVVLTRPALPRLFASSPLFYFGVCESDNEAIDLHVLLYGERHFECSEPNTRSDQLVKIRTFGPGLEIGLSNAIIVCTLEMKNGSVNVGASAQVAVGVGLHAGLYVGMNGICAEFGAGSGLGANAGVSLMEFKPSSNF
jgi:hypothetical protein